MTQDICEYVSACSMCARNKNSNIPFLYLTPLVPCILVISRMEETDFLTVVNRFSKMVHFIPVPSLASTEEIAEAFLENVVRLHGFPVDVVSDRSPQLILKFWKAICDLLTSFVSLLSGYHPQSIGETERLNQELEKGLRCLASQTPANQSQSLIWVEISHNSLSSVSIRFSPYVTARL